MLLFKREQSAKININPGFSVLKNVRTGNVPGSSVGIFGTDAKKTWRIAFVNWNLQDFPENGLKILFSSFLNNCRSSMDDKHMLNNTGTEYLNIISYFNTVHIIYCMF